MALRRHALSRLSLRSLINPLGVFAVFFLLCAFCVSPVWAQDAGENAQQWEVTLSAIPNGPAKFVAINKQNQELFLLEQRSPLSLVKNFPCSTGQKEGDKFVEGDLKTPEGVYFIDRRLDSGLDFELYGKLAFTLNFPNPIDRLKGKTGYGIWIHGRGYVPKERETKGCVALNNDNMDVLDQHLGNGMPVVIARSLDWTQDISNSQTPQKLLDSVNAWAEAWESKDESFFEFYDSDKFTKASEQSFNAFKNHKLGLFNRLPWLQVMVEDVHVLPGPDYWVTYFSQFYRSPSLTSEGVKRLYWQMDENGEYKIVGKEWENASLNMKDKYIEDVTRDMARFLQSWRASWEAADLKNYIAFYDDNAVQGKRRGRRAIREQKNALWKKESPKRVNIDHVRVALHPKGLKVTFLQEYTAMNDYSDIGRKIMLLQPDGDSWRIVSEEWRAK